MLKLAETSIILINPSPSNVKEAWQRDINQFLTRLIVFLIRKLQVLTEEEITFLKIITPLMRLPILSLDIVYTVWVFLNVWFQRGEVIVSDFVAVWSYFVLQCKLTSKWFCPTVSARVPLKLRFCEQETNILLNHHLKFFLCKGQ